MDDTSVNLLKRIGEHKSDSAWQRFVDLYTPLIFYWARGKGLSSDDASDIVQDVLSTLVLKLPEFQYDPNRRFRAWLKTITLNRVTDLHRRNQLLSLQSEPDGLSRITIADDADLFVEAEYHSVIVNRALDLLQAEFHESTWQAFRLQVLDDQKASAVAEQLNIPINAVYLAKSRVLARLRQELEGLLD
jgi:RNA polymerase sigma-70 factor (ECF subfamily)